jgi:hypothetical protein
MLPPSSGSFLGISWRPLVHYLKERKKILPRTNEFLSPK